MDTKETPLEDQRQQALKHYEEASNAIMHWSSFVRDAILAYDPKQNSHKHGVSGKQAISELITFCEEQKRKQYAIAEAAGYTGNAHHIGAAQAYHKVIVKLNELAGVCSGLDKNA